MARLITGLSALLVYGSLGAASAGGGSITTPDPLDIGAPVKVEVEDVAISDSAEFVPMGEMSKAEKERRRQVCENEWEACYDQCNRFYANPRGKKKLPKCIRDCKDKLAECNKEIPY